MSKQNVDKTKTFKQSSLNKANLRLHTTNANLAGKIKTNIVEPDGTVYWYIRFNLELDPASVSKHTMNVTETNGYILPTIITYDCSKNLIVLNPVGLYRQNEYYMLNISTKVKSSKGTHLRKSVHVLFKLVDDRISEFEILKNTVFIPKPRKKPARVLREERRELTASKIYADAGAINKSIGSPSLPFGPLKVNPAIAFAAVLLLGVGVFMEIYWLSIAALIICAFGIAHISLQSSKRAARSGFRYTIGVVLFNFGKYQASVAQFEKAMRLDPHNELAEYAISKAKIFVDKQRL